MKTKHLIPIMFLAAFCTVSAQTNNIPAEPGTINPTSSDNIHNAAQNGDLEKITALLKANPELIDSKDTNGRTALHIAAIEGHTNVVNFLLANNADVNAKDAFSYTPLHNAAGHRHKDVAELLIASKADVNACTTVGFMTPCTPAGLMTGNGKQTPMGNWTPLHFAAMFGDKDVAELLLANKADVNAKDYDGKTPLYFSVHISLAADSDLAAGCKDVADLLRQHGGTE